MRVHGDGAVGRRAAAEGDQRSHAPGAASVAVDGGQLTTLRRRRMLEEVGALLVDSMCDRIYLGRGFPLEDRANERDARRLAR
jgi:hypothetical protein